MRWLGGMGRGFWKVCRMYEAGKSMPIDGEVGIIDLQHLLLVTGPFRGTSDYSELSLQQFKIHQVTNP